MPSFGFGDFAILTLLVWVLQIVFQLYSDRITFWKSCQISYITIIHIYEEIYYKELVYTIMKAEKPQNLLSASWRHTEANDVVPVQTWSENYRSQWYESQSEFKGLRTKRATMSKSRRRWMPHFTQTANLHIWLFVLFRPSTDWIMPTQMLRWSLIVPKSNAYLYQKYLHIYTQK